MIQKSRTSGSRKESPVADIVLGSALVSYGFLVTSAAIVLDNPGYSVIVLAGASFFLLTILYATFSIVDTIRKSVNK